MRSGDEVFPGLTYGQLTWAKHCADRSLKWTPDKGINEWTPYLQLEAVAIAAAAGQVLHRPTAADCEDYTTVYKIMLDRFGCPDLHQRLRDQEITLEDGQRHAILKLFVNPITWLVLDCRFAVIPEISYTK